MYSCIYAQDFDAMNMENRRKTIQFVSHNTTHNTSGKQNLDQAPVVQTMDNRLSAIHRINHYPVFK